MRRRFRVKVNGKEFIVEVEELGRREPTRIAVPRVIAPEPQTEAPRAEPRESGEGTVRTPLVGRVLRILVSEGQQVRAGQTLLILESMKMENEIVSPRDGTVRNIRVREGETVERGQVLMEVS